MWVDDFGLLLAILSLPRSESPVKEADEFSCDESDGTMMHRKELLVFYFYQEKYIRWKKGFCYLHLLIGVDGHFFYQLISNICMFRYHTLYIKI